MALAAPVGTKAAVAARRAYCPRPLRAERRRGPLLLQPAPCARKSRPRPDPVVLCMQLLYSNPYINMRLLAGAHQTLEIQWLDFVPSHELRASMQHMLELVQQHPVKAWITDNRLIRAMRAADLAWAGPAVIQPMSELGVRRLATVESLDAMNRMGVKALLADVIPNTELAQRFFAGLDEARAWATAPL